jgi:serine O-acetyltransferase
MNHADLMRDDPDWATTRALIASDFNRYVGTMEGSPGLLKKAFWFVMPNYLCLFFYRIYRWLFVSGWRNAARLLQLISLYITRVEIPPTTIIGPACLIGHAGGVVLYGRIGARFTVYGDSGTGGGVGDGDIGGGPDLPVLGDDVVFAYRCMVLGPVRIGNGARIGPGCVVTKDVPPGATVLGAPPRILRGDIAAAGAPNLAAETAGSAAGNALAANASAATAPTAAAPAKDGTAPSNDQPA